MTRQPFALRERRGLTAPELLLALLVLALMGTVFWFFMRAESGKDNAEPPKADQEEKGLAAEDPPTNAGDKPSEKSDPKTERYKKMLKDLTPEEKQALLNAVKTLFQNVAARQQPGLIITTKQSITVVEKVAQQYAITHDGDWPPSMLDLLAPETIGTQTFPPLLDKIPLDAWGSPIQYEYTPGDDRPLITSYGPNRQPGGGDDITNVDEPRVPNDKGVKSDE